MNQHTIEKIKIEAKKIKSQLDLNPVTLNERIIHNYYQKLLFEINLACENDSPLPLLRLVLNKNMELVKNSCLSYTALPQNEITLLLCSIAELIATDINTNKNDSRPNENALEILMPGIFGDSNFVNRYPDLVGNDVTEDFDIRQIIKTHVVINAKDTYLVPVKLLCELEPTLSGEIPEKINNPYYDDESSSDNAYINGETLRRLFGHSRLTTDLYHAMENYAKYLRDDDDLLGRLSKLILALKFNSTDGIGSEEAAGELVYSAIIHFFDYYNELEEDSKKKIPLMVKEEISLLHSLVSNSTINFNATQNFQTCIKTRSDSLLHAIKSQSNEIALKTIGIEGEKKAKLLLTAKEEFEQLKNTLKDSIEKKKYKGSDNLGLTHTLFTHLDIKPSINSKDELLDFMSLNGDDIQKILAAQPKLCEDIALQLNTIDELVTFAHNCTLERFRVILSFTGKLLVKNSSYLSALFMSLDIARITIICETMAKNLKEIINLGDLKNILENINITQRLAVSNALLKQLPSLVNTGFEFNQVFNFLSFEQRQIFFTDMLERLPEITKSCNDFKLILDNLNLDQRSIVFEIMEDKLLKLISTLDGTCFGVNFENIMTHLTQKQRTQIFNSIKNGLPKNIQCTYDLSKLFQYLLPKECREVCQMSKHILSDFIEEDSANYASIIESLSPEQCKIILECTKNELQNIFINMENIEDLLFNMKNTESAMIVLQFIQDTLRKIVSNGNELGRFLSNLPASEYETVINMLTVDLSNKIIHNTDDIVKMFKYLNVDQCVSACKVLIDEIRNLCESKEDYNEILDQLSNNRRQAISNFLTPFLEKDQISLRDENDPNVAQKRRRCR